MSIRPGTRLRSMVGTAEVVVVRAPDTDAMIECAGQPMVPVEEPGVPAEPADDLDPDTSVLIGKRYDSPDADIEVLCVKAGAGPLTVIGVRLDVKGAKPLPSSD